MDQEKKTKGNSKINEQIKHNLYTWITHHPQVVQSPISNDCLKVMSDDQTEPQLQVLGNHCVYSPTYWMLNRKQQNVIL